MASEGTTKRLRSALWSSETLVRGMNSVNNQGSSMLLKPKDEEDQDLLAEYNATCFTSWTFFFVKKPLIPSNSFGFCFQLTFRPCPQCRYRRSLLRSSTIPWAILNMPLMPWMALVETLRMVISVMNRMMMLWWRISMPFPKLMYLAKLEVLDNIFIYIYTFFRLSFVTHNKYSILFSVSREHGMF